MVLMSFSTDTTNTHHITLENQTFFSVNERKIIEMLMHTQSRKIGCKIRSMQLQFFFAKHLCVCGMIFSLKNKIYFVYVQMHIHTVKSGLNEYIMCSTRQKVQYSRFFFIFPLLLLLLLGRYIKKHIYEKIKE